jgi:hypothetical protein
MAACDELPALGAPNGAEVNETPLTPARVMAALRKAGGG